MDGQDTILADWEDSVQEGADIAPDIQIQIARFFRGKKIAVYNRGNRSDVLSFVVNQEWENDVAAWDAWIDLRANVPVIVDLFTWRTSGQSKLTRYMQNCAVLVKPVRRMGCATWFQYTIIGGEITTTPPTGGAN